MPQAHPPDREIAKEIARAPAANKNSAAVVAVPVAVLESVSARRRLDEMRRWHSSSDASSTPHHPHHRRQLIFIHSQDQPMKRQPPACRY